MPIDRGTAGAQVRRLAQLPFFSVLTSEALTSMIDVVAKAAVSPAHAKEAISSWLQGSRGNEARLPTDGDLLELLENSRTEYEAQASTERKTFCGYCDRGRVFRPVHARGQTYTAMGICVCQGGTVQPNPQGGLPL